MRNLLLFLLLAASATTLQAQWYPPVWFPPPQPRPHRDPALNPSWITVGGYLSVGGESNDTPTDAPILFPLVGVFADFTRHPIRPGFDLRGQGGTGGVRGTLLGPRVSANYTFLHPYAEFLLGPNHYEPPAYQYTGSGNPPPGLDKHGLTVKGVVGIDVDFSPNMSWRVVEFSQGHFDGVPNSHPRSFSTGIVLRLP